MLKAQVNLREMGRLRSQAMLMPFLGWFLSLIGAELWDLSRFVQCGMGSQRRLGVLPCARGCKWIFLAR